MRTHPWINFQLDLRRAGPRLWMLLGEACSKARHVAGVPLVPSVQDRLSVLYLAKGVLATTAIEGNTLTEEQVLDRLQGQLELPPSQEYLGREIDNIVQACELIGERVLRGDTKPLDPKRICDYNRLVLRDLPVSEEVIPGKSRRHDVGVGRYRGAPAEDCGFLLARLCDWLRQEFPELPGGTEATGILRAIVAHLYVAWIHPFGDGNGRTARLVEFEILLQADLPAVAAHLLSNHYNLTRAEYYRQLDRSHRAEDGVLGFVEYALQGLVDGLRLQIETIQRQQLAVHWINYIHDVFRNHDTAAGIRRRHLALDLSTHPEGVPIAEVRRLTPRLAEAYAGKTDKTIQRDLADLRQRGLVEMRERKVRARYELMLAFLSPSKPKE